MKWVRALTCGLIGCLLISMGGFTATCEDISERVLRLHVLAASDSAEDQVLKLKVRDAILKKTEGLLDDASDRSEAKAVLQEALPLMVQTANACLLENNSTDTATAQLCEMYFTTRCYGNVTLPAGKYEALRVVIGEGEGQNWWCVVFPPMCLSGACDTTLPDVLTDQEMDVVTAPEQYQIRLKIVEWYYVVMDRFT